MSKQYDLSFCIVGQNNSYSEFAAVVDEAGLILSIQEQDDEGDFHDVLHPSIQLLAKVSEALIEAKTEAFERELRLAPIMARMSRGGAL